jgi:hypothetical protein
MNQQDQDKAKEILDQNINMRGSLNLGNYSCVGIPYEDSLNAVREALLAGAKYKEEQQISIKEKADKWDALEKKISKYYFDENLEVERDLGDIGLDAASAFGYL